MSRYIVLLAAWVTVVLGANVNVPVTNTWNGGFTGEIALNENHDLSGWKLHVVFDKPIDEFEDWFADVDYNIGGTEWVLKNLNYYNVNNKQTEVFVARVNMQASETWSIYYFLEGPDGTLYNDDTTNDSGNGGNDSANDGGNDSGSGNSGGASEGYAKALDLSISFYFAQQSGDLPQNEFSVSWRGDSATDDGSTVGVDLTGGWYDAGDHVKFNLPMAYSTWVLNYGYITFPGAYENAGLKNKMCQNMKWPLDYFLKCWKPNSNTLYVMVGNPYVDHNYWGRPENMPGGRQVYSIQPGCSGSDIAAETASALASGAIVFRDICGDSSYAQELLDAAKSLYTFALRSDILGKYTDCVYDAGDFYRSSSYEDNLAAAAAWLHRATGDSYYLNEAKNHYSVSNTPWAFGWDDATVGTAMLLYEATGEWQYKNTVQTFVQSYMPGNGEGVHITPCGLTFRNEWGTSRYAGSAAFIATIAAKNGIESDSFKAYAMSQIGYLLGDNNLDISYLIGYGDYFPKRPHHRGSSCRTDTTSCDEYAAGDNPNQLNGALVGGPDYNDNYNDDRQDYVANEVATDYNAGFQGAVAGLLSFQNEGSLPSYTPTC